MQVSSGAYYHDRSFQVTVSEEDLVTDETLTTGQTYKKLEALAESMVLKHLFDDEAIGPEQYRARMEKLRARQES